MKLVFSEAYSVDIGKHSFPTKKFELAARALKRSRGCALVAPPSCPRADLELAHTPEWVSKILDGGATLEDETRMELAWSEALAQAHALAVSGTLLAAREALAVGLGLHAGGGSHHAFPDHGEGFCVFNDLAIASLKLKGEGRLSRAAVVDLDVHQGNGTAAILGGREGFATFSMHQEDIYPEAKVPGTLDVPVPAGTADEKYLKLLEGNLPRFLDEARPELVLYQAGVDVCAGDALGGLALTPEGAAARDARVFAECFRRKVAVAVTLGGGYGATPEATAVLHARTLETAIDLFGRRHGG